MKKVILGSLVSISLYAGTFGCKYQSDLKKIDTVTNKVKFFIDNHCSNIYNPNGWKKIKVDKIYTHLQSPYKGEEHYKYWVKTKDLPKMIKKKSIINIKKKDFKTTLEYGDLIWQDSLVNETQSMSIEKAKSYCKQLNYKNKNWRLPTLSEMKQICPASWQNSYQAYKNFKHKSSNYYWTSNYDIQFTFGSGSSSKSFGDPALVRCVAPR